MLNKTIKNMQYMMLYDIISNEKRINFVCENNLNYLNYNGYIFQIYC